ncbi:MAG: hypothetical protein JXR39_01335 [Marinilabiliaceae bacterium]|nr:hypothetical protein [Marinilabiliaceae bacterium]
MANLREEYIAIPDFYSKIEQKVLYEGFVVGLGYAYYEIEQLQNPFDSLIVSKIHNQTSKENYRIAQKIDFSLSMRMKSLKNEIPRLLEIYKRQSTYIAAQDATNLDIKHKIKDLDKLSNNSNSDQVDNGFWHWVYENILKDGAWEGNYDGALTGQTDWSWNSQDMKNTRAVLGILIGGGATIQATTKIAQIFGALGVINTMDGLTGLSAQIEDENVQVAILYYKVIVDIANVGFGAQGLYNERKYDFINTEALMFDIQWLYEDIQSIKTHK